MHPDRVLHPCIVHCLRLHHVTAVAAAHHHTLFLTDAGQVAPLAASFAYPLCWKVGTIQHVGIVGESNRGRPSCASCMVLRSCPAVEGPQSLRSPDREKPFECSASISFGHIKVHSTALQQD